MKIPIFLSLTWFSLLSYGQSCENVIALSKTVSSTVSEKAALEQQAAAFCSDYSKKQLGNSSTNIGVSYAAIKGSFGQTSASMDEVASKVCSSSNLSSASSDAYRNYIETISPNAYSAYQQCISMTQSDMRFDVNTASVLPSEFSMTVGYRPSGAGASNADMAFSASTGISCKWGDSTSATRVLPDRATVIFKCSRPDQTKPGYVQIARTNGTQGTLTIPWIAYNKDGVPVATVAALQGEVQALRAELSALRSQTSTVQGIGTRVERLETDTKQDRAAIRYTVVKHNETCPTGWQNRGPLGWQMLDDANYSANTFLSAEVARQGWRWTHPLLCSR